MTAKLTTDFFSKYTDYATVLAGRPIFKQGEIGNVMFVLIEGEVDILVNNKLVDTVSSVDILGEMALLDTNSNTRSATAIAKTTCKVVPINEKRFLFLIQKMPHFSLEVMRIIADRLRRMNELTH